jgi:hypothetical protein
MNFSPSIAKTSVKAAPRIPADGQEAGLSELAGGRDLVACPWISGIKPVHIAGETSTWLSPPRRRLS